MHPVIASPADIVALKDQGATFIDIRQREEWKREHIDGARSLPLDDLTAESLQLRADDTVVFYCQSGMRTRNAQEKLIAAAAPANAVIMQGGLSAWKAAGYATQVDKSQPLPLMRQVQIVAGTLALGGTLAGALLNPLFYIVPGFVGAGLLFAGISGWCGMAKLLNVMPWNKGAS